MEAAGVFGRSTSARERKKEKESSTRSGRPSSVVLSTHERGPRSKLLKEILILIIIKGGKICTHSIMSADICVEELRKGIWGEREGREL